MGKMFLAPHCRYNGTPLYLSEFGGVAYVPVEEHDVPENSWGYSGIEPTQAAALERIRGLYEAVAKLPRFAGCLLHATLRRRARGEWSADV